VWKASHTRNATIPMLGVGDDGIYGDHALHQPPPHRMRLALAACWAGDTSVVTKPYRLARWLPGARNILDGLPKRNVKRTSSAAQSMDRTDRVGRCCSTCWRWWLSSIAT
jgi:hypothetical protein